MKLNLFLTMSHLTTGALGAAVMWFAATSGASLMVPGVLVLGVSVLAGWGVSRILSAGLHQIQQADLARSDAPLPSHPIREIVLVVEHVRSRAGRWADAASSARHQTQEIEALVDLMTQEPSGQTPEREGSAASQLKLVLRQLTSQLQAELDQILVQVGDVDGKTSKIVAGTEDQTEAVNRTTTYVEQLSLQFDSVAENANAAQRSARKAGDAALQAQSMVREHLEHISGFRMRVEGAERKLRMLGERTEAIGAIVETITAISSRTDLLALNASIESIRAGEQGRGFSVVAEEVRKLAEQAAQATREVSTLIDTIQSETDESIRAMAEQREDVQAEMNRMTSTNTHLGMIGETCHESIDRIQDISRLAAQQLHLTQDLVVAVERISEATRSNRTQADGAAWTVRSITQHVESLDAALAPLRAGFQTGNKLRRQQKPTNGRLNSSHTRTLADEGQGIMSADRLLATASSSMNQAD